jgi:hypothetical protein
VLLKGHCCCRAVDVRTWVPKPDRLALKSTLTLTSMALGKLLSFLMCKIWNNNNNSHLIGLL